ncbi:hypothetical protein KL918_000108 [Ogataea parapolymorpha]|uniref:Uncharacterized protein n=1 Tax=Ogataea parapolymorpha (strain ATCC 26012 / BCRC 20466 / JCM 22074 / NRRL Y-7560 / DL-1) TaxID=871575 RepID=W1Q9U7_OGAPD|nr:hypothetical protein HPODL_02796 [Ogataea parapolymorpha DL-1]ESW96160.1 hypothetical protein HPODL_02796 [Ogataea parapolymorpha DL-1]KAG7869904.1 hypothetical protein KL918_000108 [Ogataea parapolymorpha]KAG7873192.1 hypothetical protein KL916_002493 [Ogataea parapolymorpha]
MDYSASLKEYAVPERIGKLFFRKAPDTYILQLSTYAAPKKRSTEKTPSRCTADILEAICQNSKFEMPTFLSSRSSNIMLPTEDDTTLTAEYLYPSSPYWEGEIQGKPQEIKNEDSDVFEFCESSVFESIDSEKY